MAERGHCDGASSTPSSMTITSPSDKGRQGSSVSGTLATKASLCGPAVVSRCTPARARVSGSTGQLRCSRHRPGGAMRPFVCMRRWPWAKSALPSEYRKFAGPNSRMRAAKRVTAAKRAPAGSVPGDRATGRPCSRTAGRLRIPSRYLPPAGSGPAPGSADSRCKAGDRCGQSSASGRRSPARTAAYWPA